MEKNLGNEIEKNLQIQEGRKNYLNKLKARLILVVPMFILSVMFVVFGILFIPRPSSRVESSFTFNVHEISANISGGITGAKSSHNFSTLTFSPSSSPSKLELDSWGSAVEFNENQDDIILSLTIVNLGENTISCHIKNSPDSIENLNIQFSQPKTFSLEKGKSEILTITISSINKSQLIKNAQFEFALSIYPLGE